VNYARRTAVAAGHSTGTFSSSSTNSNIDGQVVAGCHLEGLCENYTTGSTATRARSNSTAASASASAATDNE
jgi:hypothetical protein